MTREWPIYDKTGATVKAVVKKLQYNGEYMSDRYVSVTISSPYPINFEVGDKLTYRGDEFVLHQIPSWKRQARSGKVGNAILYEDIRFKSTNFELEACQFTDYVDTDNLIHYTGLGSFSFYVSSVLDFALRIKACLDNKYGINVWRVTVGDGTINGDKDFSVSSGTSVWNALAQFNNQFGVHYTIRGREITLGAAQSLTSHSFVYGKGNGLKSLTRNSSAEQYIVTKLRAYGSTRNLPYRFYNDYYRRKLSPSEYEAGRFESRYMPNLMLPYRVWSAHPWDAYMLSSNSSVYGERDGEKIFDGGDEQWPEVYPSMVGMKVSDMSGVSGYAGSDTYQSGGELDRSLSGSSIADNGVSADGKYEDGSLDTDGVEIVTSFTLTIPNIGFDLWDYRVDGETPMIEFTSGMCTSDHGKFEVLSVEAVDSSDIRKGYRLRLQREYDSAINMYFPNSTFSVNAGDHFILTGISMPDVYVEAAEERLYSQAQAWLSENDHEQYTYAVELDNIFLANHEPLANELTEGMKMVIDDAELMSEVAITLKHLVIKECDGGDTEVTIPKYEVTLSDDVDATLMDAVEAKVRSTNSENVGNYTSLARAVQGKLSKRDEDTAEEVITFAKGLISMMDSIFSENLGVLGDLQVDGDASVDGDIAGGNVTAQQSVSGSTLLARSFAQFGQSGNWKIDSSGNGWLNALTLAGLLAGKDATFENLTVTKAAHFFKLVIDELKSQQGAVIITAANCEAERVQEIDSSDTYFYNMGLNGHYAVYFRAKDGDGNAIQQTWRTGDQAICQTFDAANGTTYNASNKYYWRLVKFVSSTPRELDGEDYHFIVLSDDSREMDGSSIPASGDHIVQLGYRGTDDAARQSAIILSAYQTPDRGLTPPLIATYQGINDFALAPNRKTYIDADDARFVGSFAVVSGGTTTSLETYVNNAASSATKTLWLKDAGCSFTRTLPDNSHPNGTTKYVVHVDIVGESNGTGVVLTSNSMVQNYVADDGSLVWLHIRVAYVSGYGSWTSFNANDEQSFPSLDIVYLSTLSNTAEGQTNHYSNLRGVEVVLGLDDMSETYDSLFIPFAAEAGASFVVNQELGLIQSTVVSQEGEISQIRQTATNINLGLTGAGIDISRGKITLNADNVEVAEDLTIGGDTVIGGQCKVGGFVYNEPNVIDSYSDEETTDMNPFKRSEYMNKFFNSESTSGEDSSDDIIKFPACGANVVHHFDDDSTFVLPYYYVYPGGMHPAIGSNVYTSIRAAHMESDSAYIQSLIDDAFSVAAPYVGSRIMYRKRGGEGICKLAGVKGFGKPSWNETANPLSVEIWEYEPWGYYTFHWTLTGLISSETGVGESHLKRSHLISTIEAHRGSFLNADGSVTGVYHIRSVDIPGAEVTCDVLFDVVQGHDMPFELMAGEYAYLHCVINDGMIWWEVEDCGNW